MAYGLKPLLGALSLWNLHARDFPMPVESACPLKTIRQSSSSILAEVWVKFFSDHSSSITLDPGSKHRLELEFEVLSTAYVKFVAQRSQTAGSAIKLTYSEAYEKIPRLQKSAPRKGDRTKQEGNGLVGPSDSYVFEGGSTDSHSEEEVFEPFFWKTFRFVVLEIQVADSTLHLLRAEFKQTNYPLGIVAKWDAGDEVQRKMWDVSIRTMRNCMFDGYYDCPFYEQLVCVPHCEAISGLTQGT